MPATRADGLTQPVALPLMSWRGSGIDGGAGFERRSVGLPVSVVIDANAVVALAVKELAAARAHRPTPAGPLGASGG
jgi:hypothetical protein